jgi:hypothetical protein
MAIRDVAEELASVDSHESSPAFQVAVQGTPQNLHPILRDEVYRIAAEALRNAFRHAHAHQIEVELRYDEKDFTLRIRDDGRGIRCQGAVASRTGVWASGCITQRTRTPHTQLPRPASSTSVRSDLTNEQSRTPGCLSLFWNAHTFAEPLPPPGRAGIVYCSQHQPRVLCVVRMQRLSPHDTVPSTLRPNSQLSRVGRAKSTEFASCNVSDGDSLTISLYPRL